MARKFKDIDVEKEIGDMTFGKVFKWVIIVMAVLAVLGIVGNILGVFGKVVTAPSRVIGKTLDTDNIIQSYEWFYDTNAAFESRLGQIKQFDQLLSAEGDAKEKRLIRIDMTAMQQTCRDLVTKYNANSEKMNKSIFKGWQLPEILNINNCEV